MIFISHSTKNEAIAREIRDELNGKHYRCFLSGDDLQADDDWQEKIWKALRECHAFLGLVTKDFYASAFCQQEVGAALAWDKPRLLILQEANLIPPGFAARFQGVKRAKLLETLDTLPRYRPVRVAAWMDAVESVASYQEANDAHARFSTEWDEMTQDEQLRWIVAAAGNGQVSSEGYKAGPFFKRMREKAKPLLTDQWLYENDKESHLHDWTSNPVGQAGSAKRKTRKVGKKAGVRAAPKPAKQAGKRAVKPIGKKSGRKP